MVPNPGTPEELATHLRNDYDRYWTYIRQFNKSAQ
jgi:hypothetical protein